MLSCLFLQHNVHHMVLLQALFCHSCSLYHSGLTTLHTPYFFITTSLISSTICIIQSFISFIGSNFLVGVQSVGLSLASAIFSLIILSYFFLFVNFFIYKMYFFLILWFNHSKKTPVFTIFPSKNRCFRYFLSLTKPYFSFF